MTPPPVFTLVGALRRAIETAPDALAVAQGDRSLSYRELAATAAAAAAALEEVGVTKGDRVAVVADKSPVSVAALYGVMAIGAVYVPIDPMAPPLRAGRIVADAGCTAVCVDARTFPRFAEALGDLPIVGLEGPTDGVAATVTASSSDAVPPDRACESDLAYLLYTSGSTGSPKGVMLTHRNALSFVEWAVGRFSIGAADRLTSHAPFHFDLSILDLYAAAWTGASVHLLTAGEASLGGSMVEVLRRHRPTIWYSVPSALTMLIGSASVGDLATLRTILFAGEVFPMKHLRRLRELAPTAVLANLYGPTETNVCTYHVVPDRLPDGDEPLPIGVACENQEVLLLDDEGRPIPDGEVGELWVRGPTVMKGYWGDPERTAAVLRQNPLQERFSDPVHRTGDLVRRRPNGVIEFLGRRDHQIKSRGYRIELGEIETALLVHPAVEDAVVVAVPHDRLGNALVAFVVASGGDELALKRHCAERVPRHMIPGEIIVAPELPRTSTGKIDRQALAEAAATRTAEAQR